MSSIDLRDSRLSKSTCIGKLATTFFTELSIQSSFGVAQLNFSESQKACMEELKNLFKASKVLQAIELKSSFLLLLLKAKCLSPVQAWREEQELALLQELKKIMLNPKPIYLTQALDADRWASCRVLEVFSNRGWAFSTEKVESLMEKFRSVEVDSKRPHSNIFKSYNDFVRLQFAHVAKAYHLAIF